MLLRLVALLAVAAAVFVLVTAAQPIVDQNRKLRDWPGVDVHVTAKVIDASPEALAVLGTTQPASQPTTSLGTQPATQPATQLATRASMTAAVPASAMREPAVLIRYRHDVGGTIYQSFRRRGLHESFDGRELLEPALTANGVASYETRGAYDPAKPAELFILQPLGLRTYVPIFAAAPLLGFGFGALVMHKRARTSARLTPRLAEGEKGWHRLSPASLLPRHRAAGAWGAAVVCNALVGLTLYDYFTGTPRTHSALTDALAWLAVIPGIVFLVAAVHLSRVARRAGEPRAWVNEMPVRPGERFAVKCEVPVDRFAADAERTVAMTVRCVDRGKTVWEERAERSIAGRGKQDGRASFEQRFTIPVDVASRAASDKRRAIIDAEVKVDETVFLLPVIVRVS
jgi:hypothetical protein